LVVLFLLILYLIRVCAVYLYDLLVLNVRDDILVEQFQI
jgi:hypothetical protein